MEKPHLDNDLHNIGNTELKDAARRCLRFFSDSKSGKLPGDRIDVGSPAYDVATKIFQDKEEIDTLKIFIITNGKVKRQVGKTQRLME